MQADVVDQDIVDMIRELDAVLTHSERESLERYMKGLPPDIKRKSLGLTIKAGNLDEHQRFAEQFSQQDLDSIRQHLKALPPDLKHRVTEVIRAKTVGSKQ